MSGTNEGIGWLPVEAREALEEEQAKASAEAADKLVALDPRARVLALLERAASRSADATSGPVLRPADLARVLESFPGAMPADAAELAARFPMLVTPPAD